MTALIDIISPTDLGESRIQVSVDPSVTLLAFHPIVVNFDYDDADPEGVVLPLEVIVQPDSSEIAAAGGYKYKVFRRHAPSNYTFFVPSAGDYLVLIREEHHNQWKGKLLITVGGDRLKTIGRRR